jgi:formate dehydrogenase subunit gamma
MDPNPIDAAPTKGQTQAVERLAREHADTPGALIPLLHAIQREFGYVPDFAVPVIARALNLSRAEVHGVITFYHFFRRQPAGRQVLYVCRAEACQAMGSRAVEDYLKGKLKIDFHETTADGKLSLEPVYCLGNCACSPAVMLDETVVGRVTPEKLDDLLASGGVS